jgi:hypothetical protein
MDKSADKFIHKENFQEVKRRSKKKWCLGMLGEVKWN